jgi:2-phosphosulfolactate phosphatase
MGKDGVSRADEDELCAIHLRNLLQGRQGSLSGIRDVILAGPQIPDFYDPDKPHLHPSDLDIALDIDRYNFAIRVAQEERRLVARKELAT